MFPLGLAIPASTAQYCTDYGILFAGLVLVTIRILIVYVALQRHLVNGITAGALKG
jgi:ABC-type glycerol-3-phosphate transport system permease component